MLSTVMYSIAGKIPGFSQISLGYTIRTGDVSAYGSSTYLISFKQQVISHVDSFIISHVDSFASCIQYVYNNYNIKGA